MENNIQQKQVLILMEASEFLAKGGELKLCRNKLSKSKRGRPNKLKIMVNSNVETNIITTVDFRMCTNCEIYQYCNNFLIDKRNNKPRTECKTCSRKRRHKSSGFIFIKNYEAMLKQCNDCCQICERHKSVFKRGLAVDHDHKTGIVRGILCHNCNTAIGKLNDNPIIIKKAASYLKKHNKKMKKRTV